MISDITVFMFVTKSNFPPQPMYTAYHIHDWTKNLEVKATGGVEGKNLDFLYFQICETPDWDLFDAKKLTEKFCS